jgi:hypothetical protein
VRAPEDRRIDDAPDRGSDDDRRIDDEDLPSTDPVPPGGY